MTREIKIVIAVLVAIALGIGLFLLMAPPASAADAKTPACVPAYTQDPRNDVGGHLASIFLFVPMAAMTAAAYTVETPAGPLIGTEYRKGMLCGTLAVGVHAAQGVKQFVQTPANATKAVGGAVYNFVQPTP